MRNQTAKRWSRRLINLACTCVVALVVTACGASEPKMVNGLRDPLVFSTYGAGTATYADLAAVSSAVSKDTGARLRIITSDTAIGRVGAIRSGASQMGRLGDEYIFGFEGINEFANKDWGPQSTRVVWAPLSPHSMLTRKKDGIKTPADLKGKKVPLVSANPSLNQKIAAYLAYGGLTTEDVEFVKVSYSEQPEALKQGKIDTLYYQVYGPTLFELESQVDLSWIELDASDAEALERVQQIAPSVTVDGFENAPALAKGESINGFVYTLPIVAYADTSEDEIYHLVSSMAKTFSTYENATINTPRWNPEKVEDMPSEAPYHPGLVRWLKENGRWSEDAQRKQNELLQREEALQKGWEEFIQGAPAKDSLLNEWLDYKKAHGLSKDSEERAFRK